MPVFFEKIIVIVKSYQTVSEVIDQYGTKYH